MTAVTRGWLCWNNYRISPRGKGPFRGNTHECGVLRDLLISTAAASEHSICGTPVGSKVRKDIQTVPRRIKLSRGGDAFHNNDFPNFQFSKITSFLETRQATDASPRAVQAILIFEDAPSIYFRNYGIGQKRAGSGTDLPPPRAQRSGIYPRRCCPPPRPCKAKVTMNYCRESVVCLVTVPVSCLDTADVPGGGTPPDSPPRARPLVLAHRFIYLFLKMNREVIGLQMKRS